MCLKLLFISAIIFLSAVTGGLSNYTATFRKPWMTASMGRKGYYSTKTPRNLLSWTPGVEKSRMVLDGEEVVFRVVKGVEAKLGDVPYQISFRKQVKKTRAWASTCGGTLVTTTEVLSAAHCFYKAQFCDTCCMSGEVDANDVKPFIAVAGTIDTIGYYHMGDSAQGQFREIRRILYHTQYNFPKHDFAVVFVKKPFTISAIVATIPYASKNIDYRGTCVLSGFGRKSKTQISKHLQYADLRMLSKAQCNRVHKSDMSNFICTSDEISDMGKGDSGGPLVCKNTGDPNEGPNGILVGIVCGKHPNHPDGSFFIRMSNYLKTLREARSKDQTAARLSSGNVHFIRFYEVFLGMVVLVVLVF